MTPVLTAVLFAIGLAIALMALSFGLLLRRICRVPGGDNCSLEWLDDFSVSKYRPMERLLSDADFSFLESQPGYKPAISRNLRSERRKILAEYLRLAARDFNRLVALANLLVVYSSDDGADLASVIWKQRFAFYQTFAVLRLQLALAPIGIRVSAPTAVLNGLSEMFERVQQLTPLALSSIEQ